MSNRIKHTSVDKINEMTDKICSILCLNGIRVENTGTNVIRIHTNMYSSIVIVVGTHACSLTSYCDQFTRYTGESMRIIGNYKETIDFLIHNMEAIRSCMR